MVEPIHQYRFDVDDVLVGKNMVIFVQGQRRVLVKNLDSRQIGWIASTWRRPGFSPSEEVQLRTRFCAQGVVVTATERSRRATAFAPRLSAKTVRALCRPIVPLTYPSVAFAMATGVTGLIYFQMLPLYGDLSLHALLAGATGGFVCVALATTIALSLVHELGHAAACLRVTGMVGGIRYGSLNGMIVLAADVSSVCLADRAGRAAIAISGIAAELCAASAVLLVSSAAPVRFGASLALLSTSINLLPFPRTDGYWFLRDYFHLDLRPALAWRPGTRPTDVVYGCTLLAGTVIASAWLLRCCVREIPDVLAYAEIAPVRAGIFAAFLVYLAVVALVFLRANLSFVLRSTRKGQ